MTLLSTLKERYTTKLYDPHRHISAKDISILLEALRYSPSSLNVQPWHFFIAHNEQTRGLVAKATSGPYGFNYQRVKDASHVIVLCARKSLTTDYLNILLKQETEDGRLQSDEDRQKASNARSAFLGIHKTEHDVTAWLEKQVYLAAGFLLLSAGLLKIDATPIEGFDQEVLTDVLHLKSKNLIPCMLISLGYHDKDDRNKATPKSRLKDKEIFTWL